MLGPVTHRISIARPEYKFSCAHMTVFPRILDALKAREADDILVVGGGVIPDEDCAALKKIGVKAILLQDTPPATIVSMIERVVAERGAR